MEIFRVRLLGGLLALDTTHICPRTCSVDHLHRPAGLCDVGLKHPGNGRVLQKGGFARGSNWFGEAPWTDAVAMSGKTVVGKFHDSSGQTRAKGPSNGQGRDFGADQEPETPREIRDTLKPE